MIASIIAVEQKHIVTTWIPTQSSVAQPGGAVEVTWQVYWLRVWHVTLYKPVFESRAIINNCVTLNKRFHLLEAQVSHEQDKDN